MKPPNQNQAEDNETSTDTPPESPTLTAIERQQLKLAARDDDRYGDRNNRRNAGRPRRRRDKPRFPSTLLVLLLVTLIGAAIVYTDLEQPLFDRIAATMNSLSSTPTTDELSVELPVPRQSEQPPATVVPEPAPAEPTSPPATTTTEPLASAPAIPESDPESEPEPEPSVEATPAEAEILSLPVDQLSLQEQPDLFRQLVQLYRAQLSEDPADPEALAALSRLRERVLLELEGAIETKATPATGRLLGQAGELFPELANEPRYKALQAQSKPAENRSAVAADDTISTPPPRPQIVSLSMRQGTMIDNRFEPSSNGGVLMISINYRNFSNRPASPAPDTLVLRIRVAGNPLLLAEVPIEIPGDRGTKSFPVDTLLRENEASYYQFDFILQGRVLESRIVARTPAGY